MSGNRFGTLFQYQSFGESHGVGIGCVVDGVPPRIELSEEDIQKYLDRRKPGQSKLQRSVKNLIKLKYSPAHLKDRQQAPPLDC